jgi:hypothetical protein
MDYWGMIIDDWAHGPGGGSREVVFFKAFSDLPADAAESVGGEICAVCGCSRAIMVGRALIGGIRHDI